MIHGLTRRTKRRLCAWELAREGRKVTRDFKNGSHVAILTGEGRTIVTASKLSEENAAKMALEIADTQLLGDLCFST